MNELLTTEVITIVVNLFEIGILVAVVSWLIYLVIEDRNRHK